MSQASFPGLFVKLLLKLKRDFCIFRFALEAKLCQIDVTRLDSPFSLNSKQKRANNKSGPTSSQPRSSGYTYIDVSAIDSTHMTFIAQFLCLGGVFDNCFFFITPLCTN